MAELAAAGVPGRGPGRALLRRRSGWLLLALVSLVHVVAVDELVADRFGWGDNGRSAPRIEVAFVRELVQSAAPAPAEAPRRVTTAERTLPSVARTPARPASAPTADGRAVPVAPPPAPVEAVAVPIAPAPAPPPAVAVAEAPPAPAPPVEPIPPLPELAPRVAAAPADVASAPAMPSFEWPPSTRLSYALSGYYRGPIEGGTAQVEWLRSGTRYQVRMESSLGPMFSRRVSSDGELTDRGLAPVRFEGEQKQLFRAPKRWTQDIGRERITFGDGVEIDSMPGIQDEASQFVQLTWLFTTQPSLLQVGRSIEVPMVINRRADRWIYDVKAEEVLYLPFGQVPTFHVKPRREAKGGEMVVEIWFAPSLQYLPVRMLVRQSESTYMELTLKQPPLQAAK